jgi:hypothetical protein
MTPIFFMVSFNDGELAKSLACASDFTFPTTTTWVGSPASVNTVAEVQPNFLRTGSWPS